MHQFYVSLFSIEAKQHNEFMFSAASTPQRERSIVNFLFYYSVQCASRFFSFS